VRIEDNLIITDDGYQNMTDVPKERAAIENAMGG